MLATNGDASLALGGLDQQDFRAIELIAGMYPYQLGIQKRIPGKTLQRVVAGPVGSLYVFYSVYGRSYTLTDFGSLQIDEILVPPIVLPALPPVGTTWFDSFGSYSPTGLISKLWAGGDWATGVGVCETIISGIIDAFLVYDTIAPGRENPNTTLRPIAMPTPDVDPEIPPATPGEMNGTLPDRPYTQTTVDAILEGNTRYTADDHTHVDSAPMTYADWLALGWTPNLLAPNYDASSSSPDLEARLDQRGFVGFGIVTFGVYGYDQKDTTGYRCEAVINIPNLGDVARKQIFLIGTQTLSDGITEFGTVITEAHLEITTYAGIENATLNIEPPVGNLFDNPYEAAVNGPLKAKNGKITWTHVRVYDAEPL